jgi:prevent-host-death family protein
MASVGIRELRNHLSRYLRRVKAGEQVTVKERGRAIAQLVPMEPGAEHDALNALLREGLARWAGGKPQGAAHPPKVRGRPVAEIVREDRR